MGRAASPSDGLGWAGLGWAGLGWAGLGWAGLGWAGLGWAGLGQWARCLATLVYTAAQATPGLLASFNLQASVMQVPAVSHWPAKLLQHSAWWPWPSLQHVHDVCAVQGGVRGMRDGWWRLKHKKKETWENASAGRIEMKIQFRPYTT
jgi:hypothetical protein